MEGCLILISGCLNLCVFYSLISLLLFWVIIICLLELILILFVYVLVLCVFLIFVVGCENGLFLLYMIKDLFSVVEMMIGVFFDGGVFYVIVVIFVCLVYLGVLDLKIIIFFWFCLLLMFYIFNVLLEFVVM